VFSINWGKPKQTAQTVAALNQRLQQGAWPAPFPEEDNGREILVAPMPLKAKRMTKSQYAEWANPFYARSNQHEA
jgi:hypothetical protein